MLLCPMSSGLLGTARKPADKKYTTKFGNRTRKVRKKETNWHVYRKKKESEIKREKVDIFLCVVTLKECS